MKKNKNVIGFVLLVICFLIGHPSVDAAAPDADGLVKQQIDQLPTDEVEQYWNNLQKQYGGYFPDNKAPELFDLITGQGEGFTVGNFLTGLLKFFLHEILYNGKLLGTIIVLTVFSMILENLQNAFEQNTVSRVGYAISYMVLIIIAVNSFSVAVNYAKDAITDMVNFMIAMIPLILALLASSGNITSVAMFHPLIIFMINIIGTVIYAVIFPLIFFSAVLSIVSSFSERYQVSQLAQLIRNISLGLLGVLLTVFLGVISVQGATGAVTDGVTIRTAKYVTGNFVPVVGRMISDAADTVVGASLLVKNAVGLAGVVIIILLCAFPAIKILSLALIYNLSAALMQPLGNSPIITCLSTIGKSLIFVFAALASVGLMFFLAITIIITAGNISVMIR
jgi:stage III sporulation protein AE